MVLNFKREKKVLKVQQLVGELMQEVSLKGLRQFLPDKRRFTGDSRRQKTRTCIGDVRDKAPKVKTLKPILAEALNAGVWVK